MNSSCNLGSIVSLLVSKRALKLEFLILLSFRPSQLHEPLVVHPLLWLLLGLLQHLDFLDQVLLHLNHRHFRQGQLLALVLKMKVAIHEDVVFGLIVIETQEEPGTLSVVGFEEKIDLLGSSYVIPEV